MPREATPTPLQQLVLLIIAQPVPTGEPGWTAERIVQQSKQHSASVYAALQVLLRRQLIETWTDEDMLPGRPRKFFALTNLGRQRSHTQT